jgi:hypothetical protein
LTIALVVDSLSFSSCESPPRAFAIPLFTWLVSLNALTDGAASIPSFPQAGVAGGGFQMHWTWHCRKFQ